VVTLLAALLVGIGGSVAFAQDKAEEKVDCDDIVSKHILGLGDLLHEKKPRGECAMARWSIERHEEKLRSFNLEPEECRKTDLGKKFVSTVRSVIGQEQRARKRSCKRS
jgi:hypothetical protein